MNVKMISVVIPVYNEEKRIAACLTAIRKQTLHPYEVIVVDNNCTDNTASIAKSMGAVVVKEKRQGITFAREKGFFASHAPIIARTDADAIVSSTWLETIANTFQKHPNAVAVTGVHIYTRYGKFINYLLQLYVNVFLFSLSRILMGYYQLTGPNFAVKRSVWKSVQHTLHIDDMLVHEDMDLACHVHHKGAILYNKNLKVQVSLRRLRRNANLMLIDYGKRYFRTVLLHHFLFSQQVVLRVIHFLLTPIHFFKLSKRSTLPRSFILTKSLKSRKT